jgi:ribosomal protein S18 acetylase RimI-like enzyme
MDGEKAFTIRRATVNDIPTIQEIAVITWDATYREVISDNNRHDFLERAYSKGSLTADINNPQELFFVAETETGLAGYAHFILRADGHGELIRLYILPDRQGNGYGRALLQHGLDILRRDGRARCYVAVHSDNTFAREFYQRHGFVEWRIFGQFFGNQVVPLVEYYVPLNGSE